MEKIEKIQEINYRLSGLERFGGIYSKLYDFYQGKCDKNDLKDELELMIIVANYFNEFLNHMKEDFSIYLTKKGDENKN